jgi:hypothetical protein
MEPVKQLLNVNGRLLKIYVFTGEVGNRISVNLNALNIDFSHFSNVKVILLADSIRSRLLAWFGSPIIMKIREYHPPNVYGYVEI